MKLHYLSTLCCIPAALLLHAQLHAQQSSWVSLGTADAGLGSVTAQRIYVTDVNNDQYPDIVVISGEANTGLKDNLKVYVNMRDTAMTAAGNARIFVDVTDVSGINAAPGTAPGNNDSRGTTIAALADVNNDGNVDIVRGNYYGTSLSTYTDYGDRCEVLLGNGTGKFTPVANNGLHELGLINPTGFSFLDYDKDGRLDLFIARWFRDYGQNQWSAGILMKGNGDGTFTDVSSQAGITQQEPMFGSCAVDWNNDGWPDIATAPYCRTGGQLWKNNGDGTFANVAASAGYNSQVLPGDGGQPLCMWSSVPEDFDNDGDMDFFFSLVHGGNDPGEGHSTIVINKGASDGYALAWALDRMTRNAPKSSHNGDYDGSWLDLENDGLADLVMTQGHYMPATDRLYVFRQQADHSFPDATGALGLVRAETNNVHQLEALDYDLDGDDDFVFCKNDHPRTLHLVRNEIGQSGNWTAVRLAAPAGVNRDCIGARIAVYAGDLVRMREVYAGRGNSAGQQPLALVFGLGSRNAIDSVCVRWPDAAGTVTTVRRPPVNRYLQITGSGLSVAQAAGNAAKTILKAYPNPCRNHILLQLQSHGDRVEPGQVSVYDLQGREMKDVRLHPAGPEIVYCDVQHLPPGMYMLRIVTRGGAALAQPFTKTE